MKTAELNEAKKAISEVLKKRDGLVSRLKELTAALAKAEHNRMAALESKTELLQRMLSNDDVEKELRGATRAVLEAEATMSDLTAVFEVGQSSLTNLEEEVKKAEKIFQVARSHFHTACRDELIDEVRVLIQDKIYEIAAHHGLAGLRSSPDMILNMTFFPSGFHQTKLQEIVKSLKQISEV